MQQADKIIANFESVLQGRHGDFKCGNVETPYVTLSEFMKEHISADLTAALPKVFEKLNSQSKQHTRDIHWSRQQDLKNIDLYKGEQYPILTGESGPNIIFYSKTAKLSLWCQGLLFIYEYAVAICLTTAVTGFVVWKMKQCIYGRRAAKLAGELYKEVKADLQNSGPNFAGLSKTDIMRKYLSVPRINDQLKRDEQTFRSTVWPMIESARKADKKVIEVEKVQFGRSVNLWQMK